MRDALSIQRADKLHPRIRNEVKQLIDTAEQGFPPNMAIRIVQGFRSYEEQNALYAKGRTAPGTKVTNAKGGQSFHNFGLAADFAILRDKDGNGTYEELSWDTKADWDSDGLIDWQEVVRIFEAAGYEWGGSILRGWQGFKNKYAQLFGHFACNTLSLIYQTNKDRIRNRDLTKSKGDLKMTRTIHNTSTGATIPVTIDLDVKPLMRMGKPITNGNGKQVMDDQWIYVTDRGHSYAINVNRAKYCEKMYLSQVTIQESIGANKLMDADLKAFAEQVSDKLVFQKYGRSYRVYLRKVNRRKFTIAKVVPYIAVYNPNARVLGCYAHEICIDWRSKFYVR